MKPKEEKRVKAKTKATKQTKTRRQDVRPVAAPKALPAPAESQKARQPEHVVDLEASLKGALRSIGGSKSDEWNNMIANQALRSMWTAHDDPKVASDKGDGTLMALMCIRPNDELEGMLVAQLLGAHNAAMECYRRAMLPEQPFIGRSEALSQANKLCRTYATLLETLNRHRGKGQQKVTVEHVHVHAGGQAMVGLVERPGGGEQKKSEA